MLLYDAVKQEYFKYEFFLKRIHRTEMSKKVEQYKVLGHNMYITHVFCYRKQDTVTV